MSELTISQIVRHPPFDPQHRHPEKLPLSVQKETVDIEPETLLPPFRLGNESSWLIERRISDENGQITRSWQKVDDTPFPQAVMSRRHGWFLSPHPIHHVARRIINGIVVILMASLFYLFVEPALIWIGIIPEGVSGSIRLGMLDYPFLAVVLVPLLILPIILRVGANLRDLLRQKEFLANAPPSPKLILEDEAISGFPLKGKLELPERLTEWSEITVTWRAGVLEPVRSSILRSSGRSENQQPPPGLTTPLPHHWQDGLSDGTDSGEGTPMQRHDAPGGLFITPMRIQEYGGDCTLDSEGNFELEPPEELWPGTCYDEMVRIHWEILFRIQRTSGGPLFWIEPLRVSHPDEYVEMDDLPLTDGRSESDRR